MLRIFDLYKGRALISAITSIINGGGDFYFLSIGDIIVIATAIIIILFRSRLPKKYEWNLITIVTFLLLTILFCDYKNYNEIFNFIYANY